MNEAPANAVAWQTLTVSNLPLHLPIAVEDICLWWWPQRDAPANRRAHLDDLLRRMLAIHRGQPAAALRFGRELRGRPFLLDAGGLDFNLSDTRGGTLLAVAHGARVGIDLEHIERQPRHLDLARRYFAAEEAQALAAMDEAAARLAFLRLWTAKEASCKATGSGIYGRLDVWKFAAAAEQPQVLALPDEAGDASRWRFLRLSPAAGFTAVLATMGGWRNLHGYRVET